MLVGKLSITPWYRTIRFYVMRIAVLHTRFFAHYILSGTISVRQIFCKFPGLSSSSWVLGIEPKTSGIAESMFNCRTISLALELTPT